MLKTKRPATGTPPFFVKSASTEATPRARLGSPPYPFFDTFTKGRPWEILRHRWSFGSKSNAKTTVGGSVRLPTYQACSLTERRPMRRARASKLSPCEWSQIASSMERRDRTSSASLSQLRESLAEHARPPRTRRPLGHWLERQATNRLSSGARASGVAGLRLCVSRRRRDWATNVVTNRQTDGSASRGSLVSATRLHL
jgi:hypothetical protein